MGFVRPGGRGLGNAHRCAEAVYRHVPRHGTLEIPGLNRPPEGEDAAFPFGAAESALDAVAHRWAEIGAAQQDPADVQLIRTQAELGTILDMVVSSAMAGDRRHDALADAYAAIVLIQLETLRRRAQAGSGAGSVDAVAAAVDGAVAAGDIPPMVLGVFDDLRRRARAMPSSKAAGRSDAELERLIGLIQALRAKTVEQGCPEQEALAAARRWLSCWTAMGCSSANSTCAGRLARAWAWASRPGAGVSARSTIACPALPPSSTAARGRRKNRPVGYATCSSACLRMSRQHATCTILSSKRSRRKLRCSARTQSTQPRTPAAAQRQQLIPDRPRPRHRRQAARVTPGT